MRNPNAKTKRRQKGKGKSGYFKRFHGKIQAKRRRIARAARPVIKVKLAPWSQTKQATAAKNELAEVGRRKAQIEASAEAKRLREREVKTTPFPRHRPSQY